MPHTAPSPQRASANPASPHTLEHTIDAHLRLEPKWSLRRIASALHISLYRVRQRRRLLDQGSGSPDAPGTRRTGLNRAMFAQVTAAIQAAPHQDDAHFIATLGITATRVRITRTQLANNPVLDAALLSDPQASDLSLAQHLRLPYPEVRRRRQELEDTGQLAPQPIRRAANGHPQLLRRGTVRTSNAELDALLTEHPAYGDRLITQLSGASRTRVAARRAALEAQGVIEVQPSRCGRDGSKWRTRRAGSEATPPGPERRSPR